MEVILRLIGSVPNNLGVPGFCPLVHCDQLLKREYTPISHAFEGSEEFLTLRLKRSITITVLSRPQNRDN